MKRLRHTRYFILLPLLLLLAPVVPAAEGDDPYVKLFKAQQGMAAKGDPLAEYYLGEMYESGLGTPVDLDQALSWYKRSASKGNALAKKKIQEVERDKVEADKAKQVAAARAKEAAEARARQKAEAEAKAKQITDVKARKKAEDEAARAAKEAEDAAKAQLAKKPEEDPAKREARRRAILEQVRRIQQERAKEGEAFW